MDIRALNREFQAGAYQDYWLSEYAFLRRFMTLVRPHRILVVGGNTCLDVFYSLQDLPSTTQVTNYDMGSGSYGRDLPGDMAHNQRITGYQGRAEFVPLGVSDIRSIPGEWDLIWLNAHQDAVHLLERWPQHMVFSHYGWMTRAEQLMRAARHIPPRVLGPRLAVFSQHEHDLGGQEYLLRPGRFFHHAVEVLSK